LSVGIQIVQPPAATASAALRTAAQAAEALGYRTLWLADDLLADGPPRPGRPPAPVDALVAAAHLAALTTRVRLGIGSLDPAAHEPDALVRALATIDQLSEGRLTVSLAGGAPGAAVPVLEAMARNWPLEPASAGAPPAAGPPPVQIPRPPILATLDLDLSFTASTAGAAAPLDGLHVIWDRPGPDWRPSWERLVEAAERGGGDPAELHLVIQVPVSVSEPAATAAAIAEALSAGATEVVLAAPRSTGLDEALAAYAEAAEAIELRTGR
jgi:alkanesulfonate monooxygenase SsuD/methylene tetrahydromethanopterin reductase-like flavin-dependent oxidoreductase (luciferase family)